MARRGRWTGLHHLNDTYPIMLPCELDDRFSRRSDSTPCARQHGPSPSAEGRQLAGDPNMLSEKESIRLLASLFRATQQARPVMLLGAGASFSSGIPLADECVKRIGRRVYAERVAPGGLLPERVKVSEWQAWLQGHDWFINGDTRLAENFPFVIQHLLTPEEYKREVLLDLMTPKAPIGKGYQRLAELIMRGLIRTLLTPNFDRCIPEALRQLGPHLPRLAEINKSHGDLKAFDIWSRAQIVWLHGTAEHYTDRNLISETTRLDQDLVDTLIPFLGSSPLIVAGYRGAEASITEHLLGDPDRANGFKRGVFWCIRAGEQPHPHVEALARKLGQNFQFLRIAGFDELLEGLSEELEGEDLYESASPRSSSTTEAGGLPYDDEAIADATVADLDEDLMHATMIRYCEQLGRAPVTRFSLPALLAEQGLLVLAGGRTVPTRGCMLLFGRDPQKFIPQAIVEVTIDGKKRQVLSGNLLSQYAALTGWLGGRDVNPVLKVKARTAHNERRAIPELALIELAMNALAHRDYSLHEPISIDANSEGEVRFTSPGALPPGLAKRVARDEEGRFQPLRLESHPRNRSLCDVFFGLRHMQRAGTGLADVEDLTRGAGGNAVFRSDADSARFEARVSAPPSSGGSKEVARDNRPFDTYVLNTLPLVSLPQTVTLLQLRSSFRERPSTLDLSDAGTFVGVGSDQLLSFVPLPVLGAIFGDAHDPGRSISMPLAEAEDDPIRHNQMAWLLRKHFEQHLRSHKGQGLVLESELPQRRSQRRAYFAGDGDGKPRDLIYDSTLRRGIRRQVVKSRADKGKRPWFENEGFSYAVVPAPDGWGIRIKPFYMFTGPDARTPLASFLQGSKATRRFKFDRNKNVEDDLTFFGRFIARGQPFINIGQQHVDDLLLQGTFLAVEVPLQ